MGTVFSHDKEAPCFNNSFHLPEKEKTPLKMVCGCPCGGIIKHFLKIFFKNSHTCYHPIKCIICQYTGQPPSVHLGNAILITISITTSTQIMMCAPAGKCYTTYNHQGLSHLRPPHPPPHPHDRPAPDGPRWTPRVWLLQLCARLPSMPFKQTTDPLLIVFPATLQRVFLQHNLQAVPAIKSVYTHQTRKWHKMYTQVNFDKHYESGQSCTMLPFIFRRKWRWNVRAHSYWT